MAYPRSVDDYLNLPVSKPKPKFVRVVGSFRKVLEEQVIDDLGPVTKDVEYLVHYVATEYGTKITQVYAWLGDSWVRVKPLPWTYERLFERVKQLHFKRKAAYEDQHKIPRSLSD